MSKKPSIILVSEMFPPHIYGGAEVSTSLLAKALADQYDVSVVTSTIADEPWDWQGIPVTPLLPRHAASDKSLGDMLRYTVSIVTTPLRIARLLADEMRSRQPNIVQVVATNYAYFSAILRLSKQHKVVVDVRDFSPVCLSDFAYPGYTEETGKHSCYRHISKLYKNNKGFRRLPNLVFGWYEITMFNWQKAALRRAARSRNLRFVAISEYVKEKMVANGFPTAQIEVVPNIAEAQSVRPLPLAKRKKQFVIAGRVETAKGVWQAVHGFVQADLSDFTLVIAGRGAEEQPLREFIAAKGITNIVLAGHVTPAEVTKLYRESYAVLAPVQRPEPFGRFIQESLTAGTPVIAAAVGGIPEGITPEVGTAITDLTPKKLATAIQKATRISQAELSTRQEAMQQKLQTLSAPEIARRRIAIYTNLQKGTSA